MPKAAKAQKPAPTQIVYCTQCKPPVILSVGPGTAVSHRVANGIHTKLKSIPLDPKDARVGEEAPSLFLLRIANTYKAKLK